MRVLSVDLGTSNTVAVLSAHGREPRVIEVDGSATMPSAVFADEDGTLVVGRDAERRARLDPARFEPNPKRRVDEGSLLLGTSVVSVTAAMSAVLRRVAEETSRQLGGGRPDEVRLSHPAQWGATRRNVLLSAARLAGLGDNLVLVPEPVAAAAHFASFPDRSLPPGRALAVYDLGAGTFDCAVVGATQDGFVVLAENGLPDLGGLDVDQVLLEHVGRQVSQHDPSGWQRLLRPESTGDRRSQRALREDVQAAKETLSRHPQTDVPLPEPFQDVLVTRSELEALIRPSMLRSVELLKTTIQAAGIAPEALAGIYLVGGSSRIPLVATLIAEHTKVVATSLDQPETAVALGAHHVPRDGATMRTEDFDPDQFIAAAPQTPDGGGSAPGTPAEGRPVGGFATPQPAYPTAAQPTSSAYPGTGAQQALTPAGQGHLAPDHHVPSRPAFGPGAPGPGGPHGIPGPGGPHGMAASGPPAYTSSTASGAPAKRRRTGVLISAITGAVVLIAGAVVGGMLLFGQESLPTAEECASAGEADENGFTACLRQLAGTVPDRHDCGPGDAEATGSGESRIVTCQFSDATESYALAYNHADSVEAASTTAESWLAHSEGDLVEARWAGNGLEGRYQSAVSDGQGILVFTVTDRPLVGFVLANSSDVEEFTADELADYFEASIQPGT
ncbi:actin-like ATPase involved in cell morphogenesis [Actinoalloteichus hoggarensis]|uniref:Chaperone protein DnaK n=1 Tax=Actinoalloteichus hoggarensis TaxID=1470176 RepID=A0A221W897_9PSEU|nr:Hsp70 family protein [Actinoalloteichus hoggarensis]ASO22138.1 Chaperone protein DnaK [Actinoalloteichus hoggarensis]MBB5923780.1 actin-like ATPase involved in cell morphogenesis [Actinoalloteichus hoggarensis]